MKRRVRWLDPDWYRYLRYRYPDVLFGMAVIGAALLAFGGYWTVGGLSASSGGSGGGVELVTRVTRIVSVHARGRVKVHRVVVVTRVLAKPATVLQTRTVRTPAGTRVVTRPLVQYRPVYRRRVVTVHGKALAVREVVTNTRMLTSTQFATVTNEHTVVQNQTQTVNQVSTVTRTQTGPTQTVTLTTQGGPVTETIHATTTVIVATTASGPTVTVTVTKPHTGTG